MNDPIYAAQQHEIAALCRENAKLESRLTNYIADAETWHAQWVAEHERNAKLRNLVRHMGACIQHLNRTDEDGGCVLCPYQTLEYDCGFEQRMAELGIEVDA